MIPKLIAAILFAMTVTTGPGAHANTITWTLTDFQFDGGGSATGTFDWDTNTQTGSNVNITSDYLGGTTYSSVFGFGGNVLFTGTGTRQLRLSLNSIADLSTPAAQLFPVFNTAAQTGPNGYVECDNCISLRNGLAGGFLSSDAAPVPLPASVLLLLTAVSGLAATARLRRS